MKLYECPSIVPYSEDNIYKIVNLSVVWYSYIVNCLCYCLYIFYQTLWRVLQCQTAKFPRCGVDKSLKCYLAISLICGLKVCVQSVAATILFSILKNKVANRHTNILLLERKDFRHYLDNWLNFNTLVGILYLHFSQNFPCNI